MDLQIAQSGMESIEKYVCHYAFFKNSEGDTTAYSNKALAHYARQWNTKTDGTWDYSC